MKIYQNLGSVLGGWPFFSGRVIGLRGVLFASLGVAAIATLWVGGAVATPPGGASGQIVARGSFVDATGVMFKIKEGNQEVILAQDLKDTVIQQLVIAPGGFTGWHSHPGPAVALVTQGELSLYSSEDPTCTPRTYSAGQAFVDPGQGHVHMARNLSSVNAVVWVTYFDVGAEGPRLDKPDPGNCSF